MTAKTIDGKACAVRIRAKVQSDAAELAAHGVVPGLAVVLVGDDQASATYVRNKTTAAQKCGVRAFDHRLPASISEHELLALVRRLNEDQTVDGILVQLPLPSHIDTRRVIDSVSPAKDVDGFHPENMGRLALGVPRFVACTPRGCMELLAETGVALRGRRALMVGRSNIVGRPMALLLEHADATVTIAHSRTIDLAAEVRRAEILVAAIGKAEAIRGEWVREGAIVIDVGQNRRADGTLVGDVEYPAACERAAAITPVPGGVGPMTIAMLLANTIEAARGNRLPR
ncbi:MAG: bifunctional methylenetetrahydrofolate dehydrogenase/methenyltetrahydrofolate cyclohydrolase FolD [Pseudomonadota bacterium]